MGDQVMNITHFLVYEERGIYEDAGKWGKSYGCKTSRYESTRTTLSGNIKEKYSYCYT